MIDVETLIAEYGSLSESANAIRNVLLLAQLLGNFDPDSLQTALAAADASRSQRPPSLWQIFRTMRSEEYLPWTWADGRAAGCDGTIEQALESLLGEPYASLEKSQ